MRKESGILILKAAEHLELRTSYHGGVRDEVVVSGKNGGANSRCPTAS